MEDWLLDGVYAGRLVCFVLCSFVKNALARVVLVSSRRLPIFSSVVRFPFPFITRAFFFSFNFFFLLKIFVSS